MGSSRWSFVSLAAVIVLALSLRSGDLAAGRLRKAPKPTYPPAGRSFGLRPPPADMKALRPTKEMLASVVTPPPSWDWRTMDGVTSVKNQNPYGTCWVFAGLGDLESKVLIRDLVANDYSELNVVACNPSGTTCNSGGNAWMTTNYLSLLATVAEPCNPYPAGCPNPTCVNPACPFLKRVIEWRIIPNDVTAIKNAIMVHGPVYSAMYAGFPGFSTYNGSYCLTYAGSEAPNHAVLIVGWDDGMCGGSGAWIAKNSWGASWGAGGYFYIKYGNARMGEDCSVYTGYTSYRQLERIYHYDEWGWWSSVGYGDFDDYGMATFTPSDLPAQGGFLKAVDFWATWGPANYAVEVYDDFDGSQLSGLLAGPLVGTKQEAGYYSIALDPPVKVFAGNAVYVKMRFNTPGYGYPIPCDDGGPMEINKSYVSDGPNGPWEALDDGNHGLGDIGIRARVEPGNCSREGDPVMRHGWKELDQPPANQPGIDYARMYPSESTIFRIGPGNAATDWLPGGCAGRDTLCCKVSDTRGWTIAGTPVFNTPVVLDPGSYWNQDVAIAVPCGATIGQRDTVIARVGYTDVRVICAPQCIDCADPDIHPPTSVRYYSADTLIITVVAPPPGLVIVQDTLGSVDCGQTRAYVPFAICNDDICAGPTEYSYNIRSVGHVGSPIDQTGSVTVGGGQCREIFGVLDAGAAPVCTRDTLTIVAWSIVAPVVYDTCVQVVHVMEPQTVPLFQAPVVAVLVIALLLIVAISLRTRTRGRGEGTKPHT